MAITVKTNTCVDGAFMVYATATGLDKSRAQTPILTDGGNVGTAIGSGTTISGNLTFSVDSLVGVGLDLDAWIDSGVGKLVEIDRGPDHLILTNCTLGRIGDSANPGAAQRSITVSFNAQAQTKIAI